MYTHKKILAAWLNYFITIRGMDNAGFGRIRSKGDQALFGGYTRQETKNLLGTKGNRPLDDFLPPSQLLQRTLQLK